MARKVWLARHAERIDMINPDWSLTASDPYDPPLSPRGQRQAQALARRMKTQHIDHLFSSPFQRTLQTATAIADELNLAIKVEFGASENLLARWYPHDPRQWPIEARRRQFPRIDPTYRSVGEAHWPETWFACVARGGDTMRRLVDRFEGNLMLIAHGASRSALGWGLLPDAPSWNPEVCALVELTEQSPGHWAVTCPGDISFLANVV